MVPSTLPFFVLVPAKPDSKKQYGNCGHALQLEGAVYSKATHAASASHSAQQWTSETLHCGRLGLDGSRWCTETSVSLCSCAQLVPGRGAAPRRGRGAAAGLRGPV